MILNWNGWEDSFTCLRSLLDTGEQHEVWLIDNGSVVDRREEARRIYPGIRILSLNDNYGWAGGYNRAIDVAISEEYQYVYLLNSDARVTPGFLRQTLQVVEADPEVSAVGSVIASSRPGGYVTFDGEVREPGTVALAPRRGCRPVR